MKTALYLVLGALGFSFFTWGAYLSAMSLIRERGVLSWQTKLFAYPLVAIGITADFLTNVVIGTVLFLELPREYLLTIRLDRLLERDDFRGAIARWLCRYMLDPFDPKGRHCTGATK